MILDSDIIIYSALPNSRKLKDFILANSPFISAVSRVEVLGFRRLSPDDMRISLPFSLQP